MFGEVFMARKPKKPLNMTTLLQSTTGTLAHIQAKTNSLTILADIVRQICPDLPEEVWHIANFHQETLVIEIKSPVWGQRLQFERNRICQLLADETQGQLNKIAIRVNPKGFVAEQKLQTKASQQSVNQSSPSQFRPNKQAGEHFAEIAQTAPKGLKEKLEKLARAAKK